MEHALLNAIQTHLASPALDQVMIFISTLGNYGALWILVGLVLFIYPKTRYLGGVVLLALFLDALLCNVMLKPLVARERPFIASNFPLLIPAPSDYSFPSGHTAASFAAIFSFYWEKSRRLFALALVVGVMIAFSRLYLYVHYPTDVFFGALIGILAAYLAHLILAKICQPPRERSDAQLER